MHDIPPASMVADFAQDVGQPRPRPIERLYTLGVRDGLPILVAICVDHTIWQLDQRYPVADWQQLPSIPGITDASDDA